VRTTVTLDSDVEALLKTAMKERDQSFKEALNAAIRAGLTQKTPRTARFVQRTFGLGAEQNFRWVNALGAADAIEDEELTRKLSLRK
jgi:hypothetical protein